MACWTGCKRSGRDLIQVKLDIGMEPVRGHVVAQLVEELRYKPGGRGFDSNFS
jgi:hypothetical protein